MLRLALDTSYLYASVAIANGEKTLYYKKNQTVNKQAESINIMIKEAVDYLNLKISNLRYVAVTIGPSRFTGLRVGVCVANALYFALNIPLMPICNLHTVAFNYKQKNIGVLMEAGVNKYYFQKFNNNKSVSPIQIINKKELETIRIDTHLVGNTKEAHQIFFLDARHVDKLAADRFKNSYNAINNYLKPQYVTNNYII